MCWRRSSCSTPIFLVDNVLESFNGDFSSTDFEQCTDDSPHHIAQEAVRRDGENQLVIDFFPVCLCDVADEVVDLRMYF